MLIAVNGKRRQDPGMLTATRGFISALASRLGARLVMQRRYLDALGADGLPPVEVALPGSDWSADMAVSIGGDGTFMRTARWIGSREIPIIGVNSGHLGFLSDATLEDGDALIGAIAGGDLSLQSRRLLKVEPLGDVLVADKAFFNYPFALNELAVMRDESASIVTVDAVIDGVPLARYDADGLIISTPTGSTAYNLSVGGPIIAPTAACWAVSPVAAHALTMRPVVVPDSSVIELRVSARGDRYRLSLDGRSVSLPLSVELRVSRAPFVTRILSRTGHTFYDTLRSKLLWATR